MSEPVTELRLRLRHRGDTRRLGRALGTLVAAGDLILLEGELGAGKTFFTRALARGLGVPPDIRVTSPTFELVHELPGRLPLVHVDLYRLGDASEVDELGLRERIGRDAVVVVEWGGAMVRELGEDRLGIQLSLLSGASGRECRLTAHGPRSRGLLTKLADRLPRGL